MGKIMCSKKKKDYSKDAWIEFKRYFAKYRKNNGVFKTSNLQRISIGVMVWLVILLLLDGFGIDGHLINFHNFIMLIVLLIALLLLYLIDFKHELYRDYLQVVNVFGEVGTYAGDAFDMIAKDMKTAQENFKGLNEKIDELEIFVKKELLRQKICEKVAERIKPLPPIEPFFCGKKADQIIIDDKLT